MKEFFAKKSVGFYLMAIATLCALIGLISYAIGSTTDGFGCKTAVIVVLAIAVLAGIVFCVRDIFHMGSIVVTTLLCIAVGIFLNSRFIYYAHLYYGIASYPMTVPMMIATIAFVAMLVLSLVSAFFKQEKKD